MEIDVKKIFGSALLLGVTAFSTGVIAGELRAQSIDRCMIYADVAAVAMESRQTGMPEAIAFGGLRRMPEGPQKVISEELVEKAFLHKVQSTEAQAKHAIKMFEREAYWYCRESS